MFRIDLSEHNETIRRAREEFRKLPKRMLRIAEFGAKLERDKHEYQNRTGDLEESTQAHLHDSGDDTSVILIMAMPYASHVRRLGYSSIDEAAELVEREIDAGIKTMANRIGG